VDERRYREVIAGVDLKSGVENAQRQMPPGSLPGLRIQLLHGNRQSMNIGPVNIDSIHR
jgi:hypothetical protein